MHSSTVIILACLVAVVVAAHHADYLAVETLDSVYDTPNHESSPRTKRGLLLLKKKLLLGALGLKAVKVGAVGVAGALALKSKSGHSHPKTTIEVHSKRPAPIPHSFVEVHDKHHLAGIPNSYVEHHDWSG